MPIYEYQCTHCGHGLEVFQGIKEAPMLSCPACHQDALKKLISATTFQLKGTGWYVTDIRDKDKPKAPAEDQPKAAEASATTEAAKSEAKPEPVKPASKEKPAE